MAVFTVKIGGQAGQGVKSSGLLFSRVATRSGYYIYNYVEYPSLIRGGHNVMQINISSEEVLAPNKKTDLLVALNQEVIDKHLSEIFPGGGIIFDSEADIDTSKVNKEIVLFGIPLLKLANEAGGKLMVNMVAMGTTVAVLGGNLTILQDLIAEEFFNKGEEIIKINQKAADLGYNYILENLCGLRKDVLKEIKGEEKMVLNGNDAVALGAIASGLQFAAIYPMSPISGILQTLALHQEEYNYIYKQPEDEIAAVNMAIGASFAGARSMTATSGGGFCLMAEGLGLSAITETPLVVVDGMRPGPATGLATWSDQGDLQFVLHSHQGDFPKIVLACGDCKETFEQTMQAFNLASKYQVPVVLLIDKNICESEQSYPLFNTSSFKMESGKLATESIPNFERFKDELDGISQRSIPGAGNFFIANSYEHDNVGFSIEDVVNRNLQMKKRMKKMDTIILEDMPAPKLFGPKEAKLTIVSWGSNKGAILEAIKEFPEVNFLYITWMNPFPADMVKTILAESSLIVDIECNFSGQLAELIREKTGIEIEDKLLRYDGRPFFVEEIRDKINGLIKR